MNRSSFLSQLLSSIAIGKLPLSLTKDFRKIYLLQCFVAGFRHYAGMELLPQMKDGDLLALVREPDNEYDPRAIALHWQDKKIGFIPAKTNEMLSYLLDSEALSLFAVITHLEKNAKPWENLAIGVYFIQEANKDLPAHANFLTRIEAPHYRTLNKPENEREIIRNTELPGLEDIFENSNRVINLETIPEKYAEARASLEKNYLKYTLRIGKSDRYVQVPDDGIYSYLYEISDEVKMVKTDDGESFFEFFLE